MSEYRLFLGSAASQGLPVGGVLSLWLGAALAGRCSPDDLLDALGGSATAHVFDGSGALDLLAALRRGGARAVAVALPVPGDLTGLGGPKGFNQAALEAGQAVLVRLAESALGLVPAHVGAGVEWTSYPAHPVPPPDPRAAGQHLRIALTEATRALVELDVAAWQPEVADLLSNRRHGVRSLPGHLPPRLVETVDRALLCLEVVALALEEQPAPGARSGAVSSYELQRRREALLPLERAARHALAAACSAGDA